MARRSAQLLEVGDDDLDPVLVAMAELAESRQGWINVHPLIPEEAEELTEFSPTPPIAPLGIFSRRKPIVVEGTWVPGPEGRHGPEATSVGLLHPAGRFAARQLAEAGVPVPPGWKVVNDHVRRGLVLSVPDELAHDTEAILRWLLAAARALGPGQVTGRWHAEIHRRA
jgi:hypothetical protein